MALKPPDTPAKAAAMPARGWRPAAYKIIAVIALVEGLYLFKFSTHLEMIVHGVYPPNPSFFTFPLTLTYYMPLGIIVLFVLGFIYTIRRPITFFMFPVILLVLYRVFYTGSYNGMVMYIFTRHMARIVPYAVFLSLFGWRQLEEMAERGGWTEGLRKAGIPLLAMLFLTWFPPTVKTLVEPTSDYGMRTPLITRTKQVELKFIANAVDRYPECYFVSKVSRDPHKTGDVIEAYDLSFFGNPLRRPLGMEWPEDGNLVKTVNRTLTDPECVLFFKGLDCNLFHGDMCAEQIEGLDPLLELSFENKPFNVPEQYGAYPATAELGVYPLISDGKSVRD